MNDTKNKIEQIKKLAKSNDGYYYMDGGDVYVYFSDIDASEIVCTEIELLHYLLLDEIGLKLGDM